ncbi:chemotaxis protein CheW [Klebsiella michiganensis]|nr:chemotaxis protein CheW [Klebsiella michiganensis]
MDTLEWLNGDEFPFLTTSFHPPHVYAPSPDSVISIAEMPVMSPGAHKKAANFAGYITKSTSVRPPRRREAISHPPASSPIKKPGGGGFTPFMNAA